MAEWLLFLKHDSTYKVLVPFICTSYDQLETENNSYLFAPQLGQRTFGMWAACVRIRANTFESDTDVCVGTPY